MKILQVNCVYKEESTGKIVYDIHKELLKFGNESIVCYGRGGACAEKGIYRICSDSYARINKLISKITGIMYGGCYYSTNQLKKIIISEKPDIVHVHCINGNFINIYSFIKWLKLKNIKTLITLHAEFLYTGNCGYALDCERWRIGCGKCPRLKKETGSFIFDNTSLSWKIMKESFSNFETLMLTSVSPWLKYRAQESPILKNYKNYVVLNGIDTEKTFHITKESIRKELQLDNRKVILHVTASFTRKIKGGEYVIELAKRMKDFTFVVVGNNDKNIELPDNIIDVGRINDQKKLAEYYTMADVLLLTSEKETFCMPVAESLCCGTPVVGFKAGAPEQIAIKKYSKFVEFKDIDSLQMELINMLNAKFDAVEIQEAAHKKYSKSIMANGYMQIYKKMFMRGNNDV